MHPQDSYISELERLPLTRDAMPTSANAPYNLQLGAADSSPPYHAANPMLPQLRTMLRAFRPFIVSPHNLNYLNSLAGQLPIWLKR